MASQSFLLISLLVIGLALRCTESQTSGIQLLGIQLLRIEATIYNTPNGLIGVNGTATPVLPNALVQLQCGNGTVAAATNTSFTGWFSIPLDPIRFLLKDVLANCNLVVTTPLTTVNASLPVGAILKSSLQLATGLLNIGNLLVPTPFTLIVN